MPPIRAHLIAAGIALAFACAVLHDAVFAAVTVKGSPHDFSTGDPLVRPGNVAPGGPCSACHIPHKAQDSVLLWPRWLGAFLQATPQNYRNKLNPYDGLTTSGDPEPNEKNYLGAGTIQCYDCHDNHDNNPVEGINNNYPLKNDFAPQHLPQSIMSGYTVSSPGSGNMTEDPFGGTRAGYFETNPPSQTEPYGVNTTATLSQTGGHFFLHDPTVATNDQYKVGDKLPCLLCHDPHAWDTTGNWQAFFRRNWPTTKVRDRLGLSGGNPVAQASPLMANPLKTGTRDTSTGGRKLCIVCHGTGTDNALKTTDEWSVRFTDISSVYTSIDNIVQTKEGIPQHLPSSTTACVSCHNHNSVLVNCNSCHWYPGLDNSTATGKPVQSQGHAKHAGTPSGTANSMGYSCEVCHYQYNASHNGSNNFEGTWWNSVDVQFNPSLNPANANGPRYNDNLATGGLFAHGTSGANGACAGLYCHGNNIDNTSAFGNILWEGANQRPAWNGAVSCGACHKADAAFRQGNHAVHINDNVLRGPNGIAVFSATGTCSDGSFAGSCHTGYTSPAPGSSHPNGVKNFRTAHNNNSATDNAGTQVCNSCHTTVAVPWFDNTLVSNSLTGVQLAKGNWRDNSYRLPCVTCHNSARARTVMDPAGGSAAPNIEKYWRASGHGYPNNTPVDNLSTTTVSGNVNQVLPLPCSSCHAADSRHFGNTTGTGNAWRLASQSRYSADGGLDQFCAFQCHTGAYPGPDNCLKPGLPMDHFWNVASGCTKESTDTHPTSAAIVVNGKTQDNAAANYMPLASNIRQNGGANFLCVTCHDPHGTGPDAAANWGRSFAGSNPYTPIDNVHMLRYDKGLDLCKKCHL